MELNELLMVYRERSIPLILAGEDLRDLPINEIRKKTENQGYSLKMLHDVLEMVFQKMNIPSPKL